MRVNAFARCHPAVNFSFFLIAICLGVTITHPAYTIASIVCGGGYYLILKGKQGWKLIFGTIPVFLIITFINPLLNTYGITPLFYVFGRQYTLEALCYGASLGGIFLTMMLWFGCYSEVLTSDKFTHLFGRLIPSISLLLVMILRLIPSFTRKTKQIIGARNAIGKGVEASDSTRERIQNGGMVLSSLTDWALEGSIVMADSMRARGYGTGKKTSFRRYRMQVQDFVLLAIMAVLTIAVFLCGGTAAKFAPRMRIDDVTWGYAAYCALLLIPILLTGKEALEWRSLRSKI